MAKSGKIVEFPGPGVGGVRPDPLERKIQGGGGSNWKNPPCGGGGGVWIFSGTTQWNRLLRRLCIYLTTRLEMACTFIKKEKDSDEKFNCHICTIRHNFAFRKKHYEFHLMSCFWPLIANEKVIKLFFLSKSRKVFTITARKTHVYAVVPIFCRGGWRQHSCHVTFGKSISQTPVRNPQTSFPFRDPFRAFNVDSFSFFLKRKITL